MTHELKKVMIVAGEQSGDILGAGLIRNLKQHYPGCEFVGIGGQRMIDEGLVSYYPIERLSVMGFVEPLKRLPELLSIIKGLKSKFQNEPPNIFIGVDSPDFNIRLELAAKASGIFSVHYVSPSVWAWRQGRVKKIKKAVNLMLALLPFEAQFYQKHAVPVAFVGHPLADEISIQPNRAEARARLGLDPNISICALMPGSRRSEVEQLLPVFLESARLLRERHPELHFVLPAASEERFEQIKASLGNMADVVTLINGSSHDAMAASNCVVMASGTTTLEALLLKRPMVIAYKWPKLTWEILKRLVKVPWVGLPNLLSQTQVVPELLQDKATPENIVLEVSKLLNEGQQSGIEQKFHDIHLTLKRDASASAANAVLQSWQAWCSDTKASVQ